MYISGSSTCLCTVYVVVDRRTQAVARRSHYPTFKVNKMVYFHLLMLLNACYIYTLYLYMIKQNYIYIYIYIFNIFYFTTLNSHSVIYHSIL